MLGHKTFPKLGNTGEVVVNYSLAAYPTSLVMDEFLEFDFGDMSKSESDL